jgi:hypothetical protein
MSARFALGVGSRQPEDDVAVALARAAHGAEPVDIPRIEPNEIVAVLGLNANAGRERGGNRLKGGGGDGDADHALSAYGFQVPAAS